MDSFAAGAASSARILIVDDHPIVRQGYAQLIGHHPDLDVCGYAESEREALEQIRKTHPHLAVVDITLKDSHGIELVKQIHNRHAEVKVLVVSAHDENVFAERALAAGALGYISKQEATDRLIDGIRRVLAGQVYLSEALTLKLLKHRVGGSRQPERPAMDGLTNRELEVFQMIGQGLNTRQIAQHLHLSPKTIERYKENLKHKLGIPNATKLVQQAMTWVMENG